MIQESKIWKNEQALSPEYLPEALPHREHQIQQIARNLEPVSKGRKPQSMFIHGVPGIGKTACMKYIFREFEDYSGIQTIYINTWDYNTSTAVLTKLILDLGYFIPRRGVSKDEIMERLIETLKKTKKGLVVCLDEVDQLVKKDEKTLYDLLRLNQYVNNPIGLVMISNYPDIFMNVEPRIKSSLDVEEIEFKSYSLEEMKDILTERARLAFRVGTIGSGVMLVCANWACKKGGDVRIGLSSLRKAAAIAERENSDKIEVKHLKKISGVKPVKLDIMRSRLEGVNKNIVEILEKKKSVGSTSLREEYEKKYGKISQTSLRHHIKHLESSGIVEVKIKERRVRGRRYYISLRKRKSFK